jgi:phosphoribosylformylglycinamidine cyclo-ligase
LFRHIQASGNVDPLEMYRVYNMGLGMVVVVGEDEADAVQRALPDSWVCGRVVERAAGERVKLLNFD